MRLDIAILTASIFSPVVGTVIQDPKNPELIILSSDKKNENALTKRRGGGGCGRRGSSSRDCRSGDRGVVSSRKSRGNKFTSSNKKSAPRRSSRFGGASSSSRKTFSWPKFRFFGTSGNSKSSQSKISKRRGGGGGGGRGGGGGSSGGGRSGSSGSSGGGRSSSSSSVSLKVPPFFLFFHLTEDQKSRITNTSPTSNKGGTSRGGSGPSRSFSGGRAYAGGAATPFRSGGISPLGVAPLLLVGGAALAFWPGTWRYGAQAYESSHTARFFNVTTGKEETIKVLCACAEYEVCGCDKNDNDDYYKQLLGDGSYEALDKNIVNVGRYKGSKTLLINGTLPNGTTADGPNEESHAGSSLRGLVEAAGFWPLAVTVLASVLMN